MMVGMMVMFMIIDYYDVYDFYYLNLLNNILYKIKILIQLCMLH